MFEYLLFSLLVETNIVSVRAQQKYYINWSNWVILNLGMLSYHRRLGKTLHSPENKEQKFSERHRLDLKIIYVYRRDVYNQKVQLRREVELKPVDKLKVFSGGMKSGEGLMLPIL
jgi:hypothetical protein